MTFRARLQQHVLLMGKGALAVSGCGGLAGLFGAYQLIATTHHRSGWFWLFIGFLVLFLAQLQAVQQAIVQRDAALRSARAITQKVVDVGEGASVSSTALSLDRVQMTVGDGVTTRSRPVRRRWRARRLSQQEREDLADRCEACSMEMLEVLHRPEPFVPFPPPSEEVQRDGDRRRKEHDAEIEKIIQTSCAARLRDLLNECAEAGYSLEPELEGARLGRELRWHDRQAIAQGLGVVGRRVRRGAKRL